MGQSDVLPPLPPYPDGDDPDAAPAPELGDFVKTIVIIDLVFSSLHSLFIPASVVTFVATEGADPIHPIFILALLSDLLIAIFGISANTLILQRKPLGIRLGWWNVAATALSIGIGLWLSAPMVPRQTDSFVVIGVVVFGAVVFAIVARLALITMYCIALRKAKLIIGEPDQPGGQRPF